MANASEFAIPINAPYCLPSTSVGFLGGNPYTTTTPYSGGGKSGYIQSLRLLLPLNLYTAFLLGAFSDVLVTRWTSDWKDTSLIIWIALLAFLVWLLQDRSLQLQQGGSPLSSAAMTSKQRQ